jgi:hypothetical protein
MDCNGVYVKEEIEEDVKYNIDLSGSGNEDPLSRLAYSLQEVMQFLLVATS